MDELAGVITGTMTFEMIDLVHEDETMRLHGYYQDSETVLEFGPEALEMPEFDPPEPWNRLELDTAEMDADWLWVTADNEANRLRISTERPPDE